MKRALIDVNVSLSRWPFRRVYGDETRELVDLLREQGVTQAWAGNFDALLHKDIAKTNAWLAEECRERGKGILVPFGSVNPVWPDWEDDLRRCAEDHRMPGVRLHPNYHGYTLDDPRFERLLRLAMERGLIVQLVVSMEDERMMHPLMRVPHVDVTPLLDRIEEMPSLKLVVLNAFRGVRGELFQRLANTGQVYFDLSWLEGASPIAKFLEKAPAERLLFGSHAPLFYFESAKLKIEESALTPEQQDAIEGGNAVQLLADR